MGEMLTLAAEMREELGTGAARAIRRLGMVPATVYGSGKKPLSIAVSEKEMTKMYRRHGFTSTVIQLEIGEKKHKVLAKAVELNPINELVRHVDFIYLDTNMQKVDVPIIFEGRERSIGIKRGGFLNIIFRKVKLLCPAGEIPRDIVVDISRLGIGASIRSSNLQLPAGCSLIQKNDFFVASITGRGGKDDSADEAAATAGGSKAAA
jgi:large subunit ribosomal protein L25